MQDELTRTEEAVYNAKHKRIRGSYRLKYPPKELRCVGSCGENHYKVEAVGGTIYLEHPCFLKDGHEGKCEFSSECNATSHIEVAHVAA